MGKDTIILKKWQHTEWEKTFTSYIPNKELILKPYKEQETQQALNKITKTFKNRV